MQFFYTCCVIAFTMLCTQPITAQSQLLREPDLSPDGRQLAFSYQGDIWVASSQGGQARRLTIHESYESQARWSPDGQQIAFVGNRYGNDDVFLTDAKGSLPFRLTYYSASDGEPVWLNPQEILFTSRRNYRQVERLPEFHRIASSGGTPQRMLDALGAMPAPSPDGRYIAFVRGGCRISREAYRGPANRDLWLYDTRTKTYRQLTTDDGQDIFPRWTTDGQLYFLSARDGKYNLYRMGIAENSPVEALTRFTDTGIRHYTLSADGTRFVIEKGIELLTAGQDMNFQPLQIDITRDFKFYPTENKTLTNGVREFRLSPNGKQVAFGTRGELFVKPNDKDKKRARNLSEHSWRDQDVAWLNDSSMLFLSDRAGQYDLYLLQSADAAQSNLYQTFKKDLKRLTRTSEDETDFFLSPDRSQLALIQGRGKLSVFDIAQDGTLSNEKIMLDGWYTPSDLSWSPDSKWLAYSLSDLDFNADIYIRPADNSSPAVNVSLHPRRDYSPQWSRDGSKLGFLSVRNNGDADVWFVWLREADWQKTQRDWEETEEEQNPKKKDDTVAPIQIDFPDIHERLVQVTSMPGNEGNLLIGPKGENFFFTTNGGGRTTGSGTPELMRIQWDGKELKSLLSNARVYSLQLDADGKNIYMIKDGKIARTPLDKGKVESQSFTAKMELDHRSEREQMFEEGWRALAAGFYDPAFHGRDWSALKAKYKPIALAASTRQDFQTIYNEMLGQLNASHMGFRSSVSDEDLQRERTGLLGLEFKVDDGLTVSYVVPDGPADREDSKIMPGDRLLAINGEPIDARTNVYELLEGTANERTLLRLQRNGQEMEVVIRPATSLTTERYEAWVHQRKRMTDRYSNGKLGYIHIRGMNWSSFERFERELTASGYGKDGIVIDVRFNGGGWTTDMLMTVLNVRQHSYTIPRGAAESLRENGKFRAHYPFGERLPLSALTKPSVALCNEASYSNAEIFSHAYKTLGHGTLVGQPTFGAVISTGSYRLIDGSSVRMPYRAWYVSATQENMEGGPAVPDIRVANPPGIKAQNEDPQLQKAVEVLLGQLK